ncbi:MAG: SRPBCC domain-containing protein [Microbacteriaceae bacterium]|nr:SRPBCC domain-containing protein [Microbacteriaceae bacterium]
MTTRTTLDGDELIATRYLDTGPALVWTMFTTPEHLAAFWGGEHATIRPGSVVVDLRVGGAFQLDTAGADGCSHPLRFRYEVIEAPRLLSFSSPDSGLLTEVRLEPTGDGTTVVVHQRALPPDLRTEQARVGLRGILERLAALLTDATGPGRGDAGE